MKAIRIAMCIAAFAVVTLVGAAAAEAAGRGRGAPPSPAPAPTTPVAADPIDCPICDVDLSDYTGPLNRTEINGLLLALNDEYHAWAVYDRVIADFGAVRQFTNIRRSEAQHIQAVLSLLRKYGAPTPANPWVGNVPSFPTIRAACAAGVEAELLNRDLYTALFLTTNRSDILTVYEQLQAASEYNHLPAFSRCAG